MIISFVECFVLFVCIIIILSELEKKLANGIAELQAATLEMERNRVIPEIVNLYNAENEAHDLLPSTKFITKLIGDKRNRHTVAEDKIHELERDDLPEALEWDRNWSWDF